MNNNNPLKELKTKSYTKGMIIMGVGIFLLVHSLGFLGQTFNALVIAVSVIIIGYGIYKARLHESFMDMINKRSR